MNKKKYIVLLLIALVFVTGCSVHKLDDNDLGSNVKYILSDKHKIYNVYFDGYKYYVPRGVRFIQKDDHNAILSDKYNNKYYLYVDALSYYNEVKIKYRVHNTSHYSKKFKYNKVDGYLQIDEDKDLNKYFIQYVYNYTKIEAYVSKESLVDSITYMSIILKNVKFNDKILESLIGENVLSYKEENYSLFDKDSSKENFLDVVEKYESDAYKEAVEDETIELDEEDS